MEPGGGQPVRQEQERGRARILAADRPSRLQPPVPPGPGQRETHLGLYPLLVDDTCRLLVCDFDGKDGSDWKGDAKAYLAACQHVGVPALLEISRSGAGAHAWTFFDAPVPR